MSGTFTRIASKAAAVARSDFERWTADSSSASGDALGSVIRRADAGVLRKTFARDRPDSNPIHGPMPRRSTTVKSEWLIGPAPAMATRFAFWRKIDEAALAEKHAQPGLLSDFILGSQDGLVNVLGVILGVAIASYKYPNPIAIILAGGLAAAFAESISMGAVAYTSTVARRDHYAAEVERERREMQDLPDLERNEVREILERWDFHGEELEDMVGKITSKPKAWLELMMAHELNLAPVEKTQARKSAILVGLAAILGSLVPLIPFIVIGRDILLGIAVSLVVSAITLFLIGWWKAWTTVGRPTRSGVEMAISGLASATAGLRIPFLVSGRPGPLAPPPPAATP